MELYVNGIIVVPLFKRYLKLVDKVKQFTKDMDESKMEKVKSEKEDFFLGELITGYPVKPFPLSQRIEILSQWQHFTAFLLAFERVLKKRASQADLWRSYTKLLDEATYFKTELTTYLLTATQLKNPTLFMLVSYVKGGFEENEERDDLSVRVKSLKMNESRLQRLKEGNQERKRKKEEGGKEEIEIERKIPKEVKEEEKKEEVKEEVKEEEGKKVLKRRNELKLKLVILKKKKKEKKEIVVDEFQMAINAAIVEQQELHTKYFMESIASEIEKKIQYLGLADCEGCSVGSLSQRDHDMCDDVFSREVRFML